MAQVTYREANRRFQRAYWLLIGSYAGTCIGGAFFIKTVQPALWIVVTIAIATAAPIAGVFWAIGRLLKETDEYTRALRIQAILDGGMITLSLVAVWGFFELYGVVPQARYFPVALFIAPAFFTFYGLSFSVRRMRADEPTCATGA